jgi:NADPH:quinone reductase-like Zn-dependent oxidoreductase
MPGKWMNYRQVVDPLPAGNRFWALFGPGFENLGQAGAPVDAPLPAYGPDELLIRHDACSLCFSDIKVIKMGGEHPRIAPRDLRQNPVILGHELALTVVGVGANLQAQYHVGQRFTLQPDVFFHGKSVAYGYLLNGALAQYGVLGEEVLRGDGGCYLLPMEEETGYAEAALTEPWACVNAAYHLSYRTGIEAGGDLWLIGASGGQGEYTLSQGITAESHPARVFITDLPARLSGWLRGRAAELGIPCVEQNGIKVSDLPAQGRQWSPAGFNDIVILGPARAEMIGAVSPLLKKHGILNLTSREPLPEPAPVDLGRLHYDFFTVVGTAGGDIAAAYTPIRSSLKPGGKVWVLGASGPMGQMHVQRALDMPPNPGLIAATNLRSRRIQELGARYGAEAHRRGIELVCLTEEDFGRDGFHARLDELTGGEGFDDIMVLAPDVQAIAAAERHLAPGGVMNLFVGLPRGTTMPFDLNAIRDERQARLIGMTGSSIQDQLDMLELTQSGRLATNHSVAAIAGLEGAVEGYRALQAGRFAGKVVVYPHISGLKLTALDELRQRLPGVFAHLENGLIWTNAAEKELLEELL